MAPEMVLDRRYDAKVDIWSVGVILYECLFGKAPYKSETLDELLQKIKSEQPILIPRGSKMSEECYDLLNKCLERDPSKRIDYEDFFTHPFLGKEMNQFKILDFEIVFKQKTSEIFTYINLHVVIIQTSSPQFRKSH